MVDMKVLVVMMMVMMIPMKSSAMVMTMVMISPLQEGISPSGFLPVGELFSLGVFCPAEAAVSISDPPSRLRFSGTTIYARGRWQKWARVASP
jgi:hypothetical protein